MGAIAHRRPWLARKPIKPLNQLEAMLLTHCVCARFVFADVATLYFGLGRSSNTAVHKPI